MYRVVANGLVCVAALAAASFANASSLVALPDMSGAATPSLILLGDETPPPMEARALSGGTVTAETDEGQFLVLSTSILAAGADAIPVAREEVASVSVEETPRLPAWISGQLPLIIRGGTPDETADAQEEAEVSSALQSDASTPR